MPVMQRTFMWATAISIPLTKQCPIRLATDCLTRRSFTAMLQ